MLPDTSSSLKGEAALIGAGNSQAVALLMIRCLLGSAHLLGSEIPSWTYFSKISIFLTLGKIIFVSLALLEEECCRYTPIYISVIVKCRMTSSLCKVLMQSCLSVIIECKHTEPNSNPLEFILLTMTK